MSDPSRDDVLDDGAGPGRRRGPEGGAREPGPSHRGGFLHAVREVAVIAVTALVISFVIKTFIAQAFWIPSGSMEETLVYGDRVMVSKIQAGPMEVERGDIAVFEDPGGWLPAMSEPDRGRALNTVMDVLQFVGVAPTAEGNHLIKRVVGVGGDTVACCDDEGRLTVNDQALDEPYLFPGDVPSTVEFEVTVPDDSVWVMGDHRSNSRDSRANDDGTGQTGSVPRDNVVGQAFVLLFPLDHLTWFQTPSTYADIPEGGRR
ncbi:MULTISPECIES: signal peptidase I [unclassified Ornithinimicrobium]|uniref:signal peptidase I n=1 Tax=unclassified Ornithinimicrobium TaxID=2615080 RepID=UPI0038544DFA